MERRDILKAFAVVPLATTWPIAHTHVAPTQETLLVGDKMRFSCELLEDIKATNQWTHTKLVRVARIDRRDNGEVMVWLQREQER